MNFGQGLDLKTDPLQVPVGKMLALQNAIFDKGGLLQKRNGFQPLLSLSNTTSNTLGTYSGSLIAAGNKINVFSADNNQWLDRGTYQPVSLSVIPCVRTSTSQTTVDVAVATNGIACATWLDSNANSYYQVFDSETGQILVAVTQLPATATMPRVFALRNYLVVTFLATVAGSPHLQYVAISAANPSTVTAATDISSQVSGLTGGYDGFVASEKLYVAWDGNDGGGAIRVSYLDATLLQHSTVVIAGKTGARISVTADVAGGTPIVWVTFWSSGTTNAFSAAYSSTLGVVLAATQTITGITVTGLTSSAYNGTLTIFHQVSNTYSYSATRSDFLKKVTITQAGSVGSASVIARSLGLSSKSFYYTTNSTHYMLASYSGALQPTYFLIDQSGNIISKLAYENGPGYPINQVLAGINIDGTSIQIGYLFKDLVAPVNASQGVSSPANIYSQTGINLVSFEISSENINTSEIASDLHLSGGFLWMYDGVKPVEHSFHVYPEDIGVSTATGSGSLSAQQYYYYAVYSWTDAQGNIHRSAPSIPMGQVTTTASSTNTIKVPTLRLTYKTSPNSVKIEVYRWSTGQQIPYLITSLTSPTVNDPSTDSVTITDTAADSSISGNLILYTAGGVVENIAPPSCEIMALFKSRLFLVSSEDDTIWFSKQVIQGVPVEMSDLFTIFVAPTTGSQGSTGKTTAIGAMDDKLITFKSKNGIGTGIYYLTGVGPDNTGSNNDFTDTVFITSTVGCNNQKSVVFTPQGLMFQDPKKGIWILGRDLSTSYIGVDVEQYNDSNVLSAITVPGTNQVRFTLDNGITLMYDYYFAQWSTFNNIPAISSTIYNGLHTYLDSSGQVFQELEGSYVDNGNPVLLSFTTAWIQLMGLQGFQRAYFLYILGTYSTPHRLSVSLAYDYNQYPSQDVIISPINYNGNYGSDVLYGSGSPYGGNSLTEQWRIFIKQQKCQAIQVSVSEIYDPSFSVVPGAGLTISGMNMVVGGKKGYPTLPSVQSAG